LIGGLSVIVGPVTLTLQEIAGTLQTRRAQAMILMRQLKDRADMTIVLQELAAPAEKQVKIDISILAEPPEQVQQHDGGARAARLMTHEQHAFPCVPLARGA
jgi:hypothetical protein